MKNITFFEQFLSGKDNFSNLLILSISNNLQGLL